MTGIMATIGPSSNNRATIQSFMFAGVRRFRLALSKETPEWINACCKLIREASQGLDPVQIFVDIPGTKPRLDNDDFFRLEKGETYSIGLSLSNSTTADIKVASLRMVQPLQVGDVFVIGDGEDALEVTSVRDGIAYSKALTSGTLGKRRGISVLGKADINHVGTPEEFEKLRSINLEEIDGFIVSFVECAATVNRVGSELGKLWTSRTPPVIVAKVETTAACTNIGEIISASNEIMLGRGDLLLSTGPIHFHEAVRTVEVATRSAGIPLIVATELLSSMASRWLPSRSELTEVCRLIEEGTAWFMLSHETAASDRPTEIVNFLSQLIERYELPR